MKIVRILITLLAAAVFAYAQPAAKKGGSAKAATTKAETKKSEAKSGPQIDVNSATADELKTLEGIGDARAEAIVKNRPYARKDQIVSKAGVPQAVYDKIKDRIVAKQAPGAKKKK